eukprot:5009027-Pyramimonas_sp.AAC.1
MQYPIQQIHQYYGLQQEELAQPNKPRMLVAKQKCTLWSKAHHAQCDNPEGTRHGAAAARDSAHHA